MDIEGKVDEMRGMLHELKPVVMGIHEGQKAIEERMRSVESIGVAHEIKITRVERDMDRLGQKIRSTQSVSVAEIRGEPRGGKWLAFLEFFAVLPQYWHVILSIGMGALTTLTLLWRHHG